MHITSPLSKVLYGHKLIIVCGLYKTGTSLLTEYIENKLGYFNPATLSNPSERGYNRKGERYFTHECKILRQINKDIIRSNRINHQIIKEYVNELQFPSVIKDPQFCYTLNFWLQEIEKQNLNTLILFTIRNQNEVIRSWDSAPYTNKLLLNNEYEPLNQSFISQIAYCKQYNFPQYHIRFEQMDNYINL